MHATSKKLLAFVVISLILLVLGLLPLVVEAPGPGGPSLHGATSEGGNEPPRLRGQPADIHVGAEEHAENPAAGGLQSCRIQAVAPDGTAVPGASVDVLPAGSPDAARHCTTSSDGTCSVACREGLYRVAVRHLGYAGCNVPWRCPSELTVQLARGVRVLVSTEGWPDELVACAAFSFRDAAGQVSAASMGSDRASLLDVGLANPGLGQLRLDQPVRSAWDFVIPEVGPVTLDPPVPALGTVRVVVDPRDRSLPGPWRLRLLPLEWVSRVGGAGTQSDPNFHVLKDIAVRDTSTISGLISGSYLLRLDGPEAAPSFSVVDVPADAGGPQTTMTVQMRPARGVALHWVGISELTSCRVWFVGSDNLTHEIPGAHVDLSRFAWSAIRADRHPILELDATANGRSEVAAAAPPDARVRLEGRDDSFTYVSNVTVSSYTGNPIQPSRWETVGLTIHRGDGQPLGQGNIRISAELPDMRVVTVAARPISGSPFLSIEDLRPDREYQVELDTAAGTWAGAVATRGPAEYRVDLSRTVPRGTTSHVYVEDERNVGIEGVSVGVLTGPTRGQWTATDSSGVATILVNPGPAVLITAWAVGRVSKEAWVTSGGKATVALVPSTLQRVSLSAEDAGSRGELVVSDGAVELRRIQIARWFGGRLDLTGLPGKELTFSFRPSESAGTLTGTSQLSAPGTYEVHLR